MACVLYLYFELNLNGCLTETGFCNISDPKDLPAYLLGGAWAFIYRRGKINQAFGSQQNESYSDQNNNFDI